MYHFQAYALADWLNGKQIGLVCLNKSEISVDQDLDQVLKGLQKKQISQFQKMQQLQFKIINLRQSYPSTIGRWFYRPFNKDVIQLVLVSADCGQSNVEMFIDTVQAKIFDHNTTTPDQIDQEKKKNISNLMHYFDSTYNKDPKQIQKILETLDNTKQTVQQNIEKLLNNKDQLNVIEVKSLELDNSSQIFLDSSNKLKNQYRLARMKQMIIIGVIVTVVVGVLVYIIY
ncbi:hypothetical protein pb186bvf_003997 [Paramecium bursaria]